jgi:hypothetical protein
MLQRLSARVARLEARADQDQESRSIVVWLGADGVPEDLPDHLTGPVRVIYLPRKSTSPEAWMHECALRRQQLPEEEPPYVPSL